MGNGAKAIETRFMGYRMRSRLEARWGVFLNAAGIRWEYEHEGYALPSGPYLPDFWLPDHRVLLEIKPEVPDAREVGKAMEIRDGNVGAIAIFWGLPGENWGTLFCLDCCDSGGGTNEFEAQWATDATDQKLPHKLQVNGGRKDRVILGVNWEGIPGARNNAGCNDFYVGAELQQAFDAARAARFEHGETPT